VRADGKRHDDKNSRGKREPGSLHLFSVGDRKSHVKCPSGRSEQPAPQVESK